MLFFDLSFWVQVKTFEQFLLAIIFRQIAIPGHKAEKFSAGHIVEKIDLAGNVAEIALNLGAFCPAVQSADVAASFFRTDKSHEMADRRCFSGTVWSEKSKNFAATGAIIARELVDLDRIH